MTCEVFWQSIFHFFTTFFHGLCDNYWDAIYEILRVLALYKPNCAKDRQANLLCKTIWTSRKKSKNCGTVGRNSLKWKCPILIAAYSVFRFSTISSYCKTFGNYHSDRVSSLNRCSQREVFKQDEGRITARNYALKSGINFGLISPSLLFFQRARNEPCSS